MTPQPLFARGGRVMVVTLVAVLCALAWAPAPARADWIRDGQWHLTALQIRSAWHLASGAGVTVAVLDSGVDAHHPDLVGQVLPGTDFVDGSTDGRTDFVGHGTTVAALVAGRNDDTQGIAGVAPRAKILPVRVLDKDNRYGDASLIARGVRWAVDHGAGVINLSLGGAGESSELADAIGYAQRREVVVVACTGNVAAGAAGPIWYPAREHGVIAVAGLVSGTPVDTPWPGGLTGPQTVLSAPAVDLLGAKPGGYWRVQGTSFAAPLVSGTAALVRSRWPGLSAANVVNRLIRTARDLGPAGRDDRYGFGEVDPVSALTTTVAAVARNPLGTAASASGWGASAASPTPAPSTSTRSWLGNPAGQRTPHAVAPVGHAAGRVQNRTELVAHGVAALSSLIALGALLTLLHRQRIRRRRRYQSPWSRYDPPAPPAPPR